jgi:hypothetical protein
MVGETSHLLILTVRSAGRKKNPEAVVVIPVVPPVPVSRASVPINQIVGFLDDWKFISRYVEYIYLTFYQR